MEKIDRKKMKRGLFVAQLNSYLSFRFEGLRVYFDSVQHLFEREEERISESMDSQAARLSQEEQDRFYEWHNEDYWKFKDSFPNIHRNSVFISIYSELEDVLKFICSALAREKGCIIQVYKWRGGILEKVRSCLKKDIGIELSPIESLWDEIMKIRKIRNAIVHDGGWLDGGEEADKADKELVDYIRNEKKSIKLLKRDAFYKIQLTDSFVSEVLDAFDQLIKELLTPISDWVRQAWIL